MRLPPRGHLGATDTADPPRYDYRAGLILLLREKLRRIRDVLLAGECGALLEVGYGSGTFYGIFLCETSWRDELAGHTRQLFRHRAQIGATRSASHQRLTYQSL
jgi:hypothetical protein